MWYGEIKVSKDKKEKIKFRNTVKRDEVQRNTMAKEKIHAYKQK